MLTSSELNPTPALPGLSRQHCWLLAAAAPLLIAPFWLMLPDTTPTSLNTLSGLILVLLLTASTATDIAHRKIFNWATYSAIAWALAINSPLCSNLNRSGAIGLSNSLAGATVCFCLMLIAYTMARGGAGDVKLAAAIGALVGVDSGVLIIAFSYIIAALCIVGWTTWVHGPLNLLIAACRRVGAKVFPLLVQAPSQQQSILLDKPIPLAGFFAAGTLCAALDVPALLRSM